jgi:predicted nucleotidyltransferase
MEPTSLTITAIVTALIIEASKETGKLIVKGSQETVVKLIEMVRSHFKANSTEEILNNLQSNPNEANKSIFSSVLIGEIDKDSDFLVSLLEFLKKIDELHILPSQEMLSNLEVEETIEVKTMLQESTQEGQINQKMGTNIKAKNIKFGDLSQKS